MALSVLGLLLQSGLELNETGINCTSFSVTYKPEFITKTKNFQNQTAGRILPTLASREISIDCEVLTSAAAGLMLATFLAGLAASIANDISDFGSPAGLIMLDSVDVKQGREELRTASFKLSSDPLFTAV